MSRRLDQMSIRAKLAVLALIPLLGMTWFAGSTALDKRAAASEAAELDTLVELSVRIGNLLHETQKERGATAVYMSSGGAKFQTELPAQQATTDGPRAEFYAFIDEELSSLPEEVQAGLVPAVDALANLDDIREGALSLAAETRSTIGYFTDMNAKFLGAIGSVASASSNAELRGNSIAYLSFLNAKEKAGIERAQLSNVFGEDQFAPGQYATVVSLISAQTSFLGIFGATAPPAILEFFDEKQADPIVAQTLELENIALENGVAAFGVDSAVWFDTITARINLLKEVEDAQADGILARSGEISSASTTSFRLSVLMTMIMISITLGVAFMILRSIERTLKKVSDGAKQIAEGDLSVEPLDIPSNDEIGKTGESFNEMLEMLVLMSSQAEALAHGDLENEALELSVPGELGVSFATMVSANREFADILIAISEENTDITVTARSEEDVVSHAAQRLLDAAIQQKLAREENRKLSEAAEAAAAEAEQMAAEQEQAKGELEVLLHRIAENASQLNQETGTLTAASTQLNSSADQTSGYAQEVFESGSFVDEATQAVAASILEMNTSIGEIANTAEEAARMAEDALGRGSETAKIIETLNGAASNIGSIVDVIQEIAKQTNLLALNAAIEAARAGEAGRGFAVVATEVKALAEQTAGSTSEIVEMVEEVQAGCRKADMANKAVVETVSNLTETSSVIAAAVEEQTATNEEVTNRIDDVAKSMADISRASAEMAELAKGSQDASSNTHGSAEAIATLASQLEELVSDGS